MKKESKLAKSKLIRAILIALGWISFVLGTIGIFIPVLPTVPFYLLTTFCFVRGSERFANWFLNSKFYKNHMGNFANHRVMTVYGELILLLLVSAMLLVSNWFINKLAMSIVFSVLIACKYAYFVFRITPISKSEYIQIKEADLKARLLKEKKEEGLNDD